MGTALQRRARSPGLCVARFPLLVCGQHSWNIGVVAEGGRNLRELYNARPGNDKSAAKLAYIPGWRTLLVSFTAGLPSMLERLNIHQI